MQATQTMFSLTEDSKGKSLSIFYTDGDSETVAESHVAFKAVIEKLFSGSATDDEIRELTRVRETIVKKMSAVSERVSVDGTTVYFDGDPLRGEVSDIIKKMFEEGKELDFKPLVNFLEKAKTNPSLKSIDDLYRWIRAGDLVIDPEGFIIAYKAVRVRDGVNESIHAGNAFVNGVEVNGYIPNAPGTEISMARSKVNDNEFEACSYGLHAGTYGYASMFAGWQGGETTRLILVRINPRDVVSVPNDHSDQKMRVSRYTVLTQIEERLNSPIYQPSLDLDEDEDDEDEDYDYDEEYDWENDEDEDPFGEDEEDEEDGEDSYDPSPSVALRNALGQFTPQAAQNAKRDSKGRFVG